MTAKEIFEKRIAKKYPVTKMHILEAMIEYASLKAEEASVEFAEWIAYQAERIGEDGNNEIWHYSGKEYTTSELYQTFKNQKK